MASSKSSAKVSPGKRPVPASTVAVANVKPATKAKLAAKPEPAAKTKAAPKKAVAKPAPKTVPKAARPKPASSRAKKPAVVPQEQRRHYVEMAAYYIAERRGFGPGNLLDDWVQAEAEIDRLLAEGRLGG